MLFLMYVLRFNVVVVGFKSRANSSFSLLKWIATDFCSIHIKTQRLVQLSSFLGFFFLIFMVVKDEILLRVNSEHCYHKKNTLKAYKLGSGSFVGSGSGDDETGWREI